MSSHDHSQPASSDPNGNDEDDTLALVRKAQLGDEKAMGRFFEKQATYLHRLVRRRADQRVRRRMSLSDLVQNSVVAARVHLEKVDLGTRTKIKAWFEHITKREVDRERKLARAQKRDPYLEVQDGSADGLRTMAVGGPSPSEFAIQAEQVAAIDEVLATLSPEHREVITLRSIQERSWAEVARRTGKSEKAAQSTYDRAMAIFVERIRPRLDS